MACWIQQLVPPKQVVGFSCVWNSEADQLARKLTVWAESLTGVWVPRAEPKFRVVGSLTTLAVGTKFRLAGTLTALAVGVFRADSR